MSLAHLERIDALIEVNRKIPDHCRQVFMAGKDDNFLLEKS